MENNQLILTLFEEYMTVWKTKKLKTLHKMIDKDILSYLSICKYTPDCSWHSLYGMYDFISMIPVTDDFQFEVTHFVCRNHNDKIYQYSQVACIASNDNGDDFQFVATFVNVWKRIKDDLKIIEMRMDVNPLGGELFDYFKKEWLFEPEIAILNGTVHLPCIFPELDSPYQYDIGDMGDISEVIKRYFYGLDHLHFIHVKDVLDEDFLGGKYEYIVKEKFLRQRYRYSSHPYNIKNIEYADDEAFVTLSSILSHFSPMKMTLKKRCTNWKIYDIEVIGNE